MVWKKNLIDFFARYISTSCGNRQSHQALNISGIILNFAWLYVSEPKLKRKPVGKAIISELSEKKQKLLAI